MKRLFGLVLALSCATLLSESAQAQSSDDCATPTPISGAGTFNFDNTNATTGSQGQGSAACNAVGGPGIDHDVWFQWTTASTGLYTLTSCGTAGFDTKIAIYVGAGCPTAGALVCNDDSCGLQSEVDFAAIYGTTYTIQIGSAPGAAGGSGAFSILSLGGGCPTPSSGPDVIVGDITGVLNVPAVSGHDAFALGTTSCNIGDMPVQWQSGNNRHPVIGCTMYRYKIVGGAGRFEQVGMSWLKHGFAALAGGLCCTCTDPGTNALLGVGCSDPYDAVLNGQQWGLSPRWQVNAHTGVFAFPAANPPWSGFTARRCQVAISDLEITGGPTHFFGECTYVTQDDAAAGNNDNNASYSEIAVTGDPTDFSFALAGSTQRMLPAIAAWPTLEPGVTLTSVHVPGDGLFVFGSHATNLGGGQWHYEYAVLNMDSDRDGGQFQVPVDAGVSVTNVGFHDVAYHDGDGPGDANFDGTDWTQTLASGALSWSTATAAQNPSANALRWGTTYNFRFDANVAPRTGNLTLGLWKSGSPGAIRAAGQVPGAGPTTFAFCFGDGSGTPCPCGNDSPVGSNAGCLNSFGTGAVLSASGTASVSADTFVISGASMPNSTALYFQGTAQTGGGAGAPFGDGLRCAGGSVVRLGTEGNAGGASQYPAVGDLAISLRGGNAAGDVRTYQCWYRNAAAFCQPQTFNLTNGVQATWQP